RSRAPPRPVARAAREGQGRGALSARGQSRPCPLAAGARPALEEALDLRRRSRRSLTGGARGPRRACPLGTPVLADGPAALRRLSLPVPAPGHPPSRAPPGAGGA